MALALSVALTGCRDTPGADADAGSADAAYPAPRDDLVPAVGSDVAVDVATWNIENYPKATATPVFVADLVHSMDVDLVAVQEIEDTAAFDELMARLPEHEGVLSSHTYGNGSYQKLGFVYRVGLVELSDARLLFDDMGYVFPRPPLEVTVTVDDGVHLPLELVAIAVHLKAGTDFEDRQRREDAVAALETHVAGLVAGGAEHVVVLGDFNEILTSADGREVMGPWLDQSAPYTVLTDPLAQSGEVTFLPFERMLDHAVATSGLDDELAGGQTVIPRLDQQTFNYQTAVSDHLPVVFSMPVLQ